MEGARVYLPSLFEAERCVADVVAALARRGAQRSASPDVTARVDRWMDQQIKKQRLRTSLVHARVVYCTRQLHQCTMMINILQSNVALTVRLTVRQLSSAAHHHAHPCTPSFSCRFLLHMCP